MKHFEEYIKEMSIAGYGDWEPSKEMIGTKSAFVINKKWEFIGEIKTKSHDTYKVYRLDDTYICGDFVSNDELFELVIRIKLTEHKNTAIELGIKNRLMNVDGVKVDTSKQGDGIASSLYAFLVKHEKFLILGDEIQYFGARRLWSRLSKRKDLIVSIVDISSFTYLEKDVLIKHGLEDFDFDDRIWSYDYDKKDIRLILKDLK